MQIRPGKLKLSNNTIGVIAAVAPQFIFGLSFLFTRQAVQTVAVLDLLAWRFFIAFAGLNLLRLTGLIRISLRGKAWKLILLMGLLEPILYYICETNGILRTSASESGLIIAIIPIVSMLLAIPLQSIYPSRRQAVAIFLSVLGVALVILARSGESTLDLPGYSLLLAAVVCASLYGIISEMLTDFSSAEKTYVQMGIGCIAFCTYALLKHGAEGSLSQLIKLPFANPVMLRAVLFLAILSTVLAYMLINEAIARLGINKTTSFTGLTTLVSVIAGALILHESLNIWQAGGAALIIIGVTGAQDSKAASYVQRVGSLKD